MPFIEVNDLTIYYELHGRGPNVLHISGSGGDLRQTAPQLHGLNRDFLGLHYDQRCLGQTTLGDHEPTMFDYADDAAALCAALGWGRARVVGTSFGGMVAQHLAIRHPDLVERLVLNCTSPGGSLISYPLDELGPTCPTAERTELIPFALWTLATASGSGDELIGLEGLTSQFRDGYALSTSAESAKGFAKQLEARRHHDVTAGLILGRFGFRPSCARGVTTGLPRWSTQKRSLRVSRRLNLRSLREAISSCCKTPGRSR